MSWSRASHSQFSASLIREIQNPAFYELVRRRILLIMTSNFLFFIVLFFYRVIVTFVTRVIHV